MISIVKLGSNETKRFIDDTHESVLFLYLYCDFSFNVSITTLLDIMPSKIFTTSKIFTQHENNFFQKKIRNEKRSKIFIVKNCPHDEKIARTFTLMQWQRICLCVFAHTILRCWLNIKMWMGWGWILEKY